MERFLEFAEHAENPLPKRHVKLCLQVAEQLNTSRGMWKDSLNLPSMRRTHRPKWHVEKFLEFAEQENHDISAWSSNAMTTRSLQTVFSKQQINNTLNMERNKSTNELKMGSQHKCEYFIKQSTKKHIDHELSINIGIFVFMICRICNIPSVYIFVS